MKLDIANFHVVDIQFGEKTAYADGLETDQFFLALLGN